MTAVARLRAVMGLDPREFEAGIDRASNKSGGFQKTIQNLGTTLAAAFSVRAVVRWGAAFVNELANLSIKARNVGVMTSELMALRDVGAQTGTTIEDITAFISRLTEQVDQAVMGTKELPEIYKTLGFSLDQLRDMTPVERLRQVGTAAAASHVPLKAFSDLFGMRRMRIAMAYFETLETGYKSVAAAAGGAADIAEQGTSWWARINAKVKEGLAMSMAYSREMHAIAKGQGAGNARAAVAGTAALVHSLFRPALPILEERALRRSAEIREKYDERALRDRQELGKALEQQDRDSAAEVMKELKKLDDSRLEGLDKMKREEDIAQAAITAAMVTAGPHRMAALQQLSDRRKAIHEEEVAKFIAGEAEKAKAERDRTTAGLAREHERLQEQMQSVAARTRGQGVPVDSMARVGGFLGGERPGMQLADRTFKVAQEQSRISEQIRDIVQRMSEVQAADSTTGSGGD